MAKTRRTHAWCKSMFNICCSKRSRLTQLQYSIPTLHSIQYSVPVNMAKKSKWAATWQNQRSDCVPSKDSDQPGHPLCLIRVFAVHMKKAWFLSYPLSAQRRLWSDWADAQADLSLRWAHSHFVGFVMSQLKCNCTACMHLESNHSAQSENFSEIRPGNFCNESEISLKCINFVSKVWHWIPALYVIKIVWQDLDQLRKPKTPKNLDT